MSEKQKESAAAGARPHPAPDDRQPMRKRQTELRAAYEKNVTEGKAPYDGVWIKTRGELLWVLFERNWIPAHLIESLNLNLNDPAQVWATLREYQSIRLSDADFRKAQFLGARLNGIYLCHANCSQAHFSEVYLTGAVLDDADLSSASLGAAVLSGASVERANLRGANLYKALLQQTNFQNAILVNARLMDADLEGSCLAGANLCGANLRDANLGAADIREAKMDSETNLSGVTFDSKTLLADINWNGVPITRVSWELVQQLGDEARARAAAKEWRASRPISPLAQTLAIEDAQTAVRACRQVATLLRSQGMSEHADRIAYHGQVLQRTVLHHQTLRRRLAVPIRLRWRLRAFAAYCGSGLLDLIAGYGYRPGRSAIAYLVVIMVFAGFYLLNGQFAVPHLRWDEALVLSISSFHGRGFFTSGISLSDTLARLAAGEAIIGLLLEVTFIATFTNRFFSR